MPRSRHPTGYTFDIIVQSKRWVGRDHTSGERIKLPFAEPLSILWALFAPLAQRAIRTLSKRVFYISFSALFGTNALPYHVEALSADVGVVFDIYPAVKASRIDSIGALQE